MANARTIQPERPSVELILSADEAEFLFRLTDFVSGDPDKSCRKFADSINDALAIIDLGPGPYFGNHFSGRVECKDFS